MARCSRLTLLLPRVTRVPTLVGLLVGRHLSVRCLVMLCSRSGIMCRQYWMVMLMLIRLSLLTALCSALFRTTNTAVRAVCRERNAMLLWPTSPSVAWNRCRTAAGPRICLGRSIVRKSTALGLSLG